MKILISTDIEGIAGVVDPEQTRPGNAEYEHARQWMVEEANAAIAGAFDGGAETVYINDSHAGFRNMRAAAIDQRARLITGKPRADGMMAGLSQHVDAVALIGYHSRAGGRGVLAHTINGFAFAEITLNGMPVGEAALYGAMAGERGVPLILASGDNVFIEENQALFPDALFVETKQALGAYSAVSLTPQASAERIYEHMAKAVRHARATRIPPLRIATPCECTVRANKPALADMFAMMPDVVRVDAVHVRFTQPDVARVVRMLNVFSAMSAVLR